MKRLTAFVSLLLVITVCACHSKQHTAHIMEQPPAVLPDTIYPFITVAQIAAQLEKGNIVTGSHIGVAGSPSSQWQLYLQLKDQAGTDELLRLTDHASAVVRCYAFHALAARRYDKLFAVLTRHLYDNGLVATQSGCMGATQIAGDYFLNVVTPGYIDLEVYKLTDRERNTVDSLLLNDRRIVLSSRSAALLRATPATGNYNRVRALVVKNRNQDALVALARYKREKDRQLIASFFADDETQYAALFAVREYADTYFYPFVTKVFEQEWKLDQYDYQKWRMCYQALAKYPVARTLQLFERTIQVKDEFRHQTLCTNLLVAITKYPHALYGPVKEKIKLTGDYQYDVQQQLDSEYEK